ncbi:MAG: CHASE2 domain-containing protein [Desulfobacterales bacterium]|nr:CHASE2 domain-containing protein [Desulfobacterales bacterium]
MRPLINTSPFFWAILVILGVMTAYLIGLDFLDHMELKTIDLRFRARGEIAAGSQVTVAAIDEKSIDREGKWVWPRRKFAKLVDKLSAAGAKVIAFDIGFLDPDKNDRLQSLETIIQRLKDLGIKDASLSADLAELKRFSDNDQLLAAAIRNAGSKVVLGYFFQMDPEAAEHSGQQQWREHIEAVESSRYRRVFYASGAAREVPFIKANMPESNIQEIAEAAEYSGHFNMLSDQDGVIRRIPCVLECRNTLYAHLCMKTLAAYLGAPLSLHVADYGVERLSIGGLDIPTDELGRLMVNYRGGPRHFDHISVTDILNDQVDDGRIRDKIVLVGVTAVGIYDLRVTPFSNVLPGLEVHANLIDSILAEDFLRQPSWGAVLDILGMLAGGLLLGFVLPRIGATAGALLALLIGVSYVGVCQMLFSKAGIVVNIVYPLLVFILIYLVLSLHRYLVQESQKRFIKNAFATYLSPAVVEQLIASPEKLVLGGEKREITAFFSDVEGFTSISEKLDPAALVDLLNEFLTEMTDLVLENAGMVDKFEGDAIIAMFGAPNHLNNHAQAACHAAIDMQKRLDALRSKWEQEKGVCIRMRAGLYSGPAIVGNMGSKNRMDYTMMGDTVNTAARLEGVNKFYGTYIMIGKSTYKAASDTIFAREIDSINVVGKTRPVQIYQLIGYAEEVDDSMRQVKALYEKGLYAYRNRQWQDAIGFFEQVLSIRPDDKPSLIMVERCRQYQTNPPDDKWNGAYSMANK